MGLMKKILLLAAATLILFSGFYLISNNKDSESLVPPTQETASTPVDISWKAESITGGSNVSTYNLTLVVRDQTFVINDYIEDPLYGCYDLGTEVTRPADTESPSQSISDQLCYYMAGGDLFYVVQNGEGYQVMHKQFTDGVPEQSAKVLFSI